MNWQKSFAVGGLGFALALVPMAHAQRGHRPLASARAEVSRPNISAAAARNFRAPAGRTGATGAAWRSRSGRGGHWDHGNRWGHRRHHRHRGYYPYYYSYYPYGYPFWGTSFYFSNYQPVYYARGGASIAVEVQRVLARAGYYHGAIDGIIGRGTRHAIRQYERAAGLPVDGRIDTDLLATMGLG